MGKVRLDCNYLKLLLLLSELYFIFIHHELASLCLGCLFAFLIAPNSLIDCGVRQNKVQKGHTVRWKRI